MVAHYARADDGSPGVIRIGQLAERVVVALPRLCILRSSGKPGGSVRGYSVELNSIDERVLIDRPGVRGALAQCLAVGFAGSSDVLRGDRCEWDKLDGIDLDLAGADPVAATLLDPWLLPKSNGERDVTGEDVVAQLTAELHARHASDVSDRARGIRIATNQPIGSDRGHHPNQLEGPYGSVRPQGPPAARVD
jgi:hypothetical protein